MNTCEKCGRQFQPAPGKEWAKVCFDCWKQDKLPSQQKPAITVSKETTMYVSYCKDLAIAMMTSPKYQSHGMSAIMDDAIALVQQAKKAFTQ